MDKDTFCKLKVADIKALFETEQALEILPLAQEDDRSSVQKLAASYIKRQEKELKEQQRLMVCTTMKACSMMKGYIMWLASMR